MVTPPPAHAPAWWGKNLQPKPLLLLLWGGPLLGVGTRERATSFKVCAGSTQVLNVSSGGTAV